MNNTIRFFGTILLTVLCLQTAAVPAFAGALDNQRASSTAARIVAENKITEIGVGCGSTKQEALRDAMKRAIEKAVGSYVTTKAELKDQNLSERIIVASDAVVTDYEELGSWEKNGTWMVKINANVLPNEYMKYCPVEATLDVSREIGNMLNTVDTLRKADLILNEIFEDHLLKILKYQKTSFRTGSRMDLDNKRVSLDIDFNIAIDSNEFQKFRSRLCAFLDQIARNKATYTVPDSARDLRLPNSSISDIQKDWGKYLDTVWKKSGLADSEDRDYRYILFKFKEDGRTKVTFYLVRRDIYELFTKNISEALAVTISFSMKDGSKNQRLYFLNAHSIYREVEIASGDRKALFFYDEDDIYYSEMERYLFPSTGTFGKLPLKGYVSIPDVPIDFVKNIKDMFIYAFVPGRNDSTDSFTKKADAIERKFWHVREQSQ